MLEIEQYKVSAEFIKSKIGKLKPEILIILGSGLGKLAESMENAVVIPYGEIPGFKKSTAPGHDGNFITGFIKGKCVAVLQGRLHLYEGHTAEQAVYPVRTARLLGIDKLIVTNASGAVNREYRAGDIMLISDHISLFGETPLTGRNIAEFGDRFPDMSAVYDESYRNIARKQADKLGISLREGVYFYSPGPQYETPAEIRMVSVLGGDSVGMSTVPEVIAAKHCGMKILGISLITNMAAGISKNPLSEQEVIDTANASAEKLTALVNEIIPYM